MTLAFQDEAGLRQAGACPSGHSGAWWAEAEKAAKYWAVAPGVARAPGQGGLPWQRQALAPVLAGARFPLLLVLPVLGSALPQARLWQARALPSLQPLALMLLTW